MSRRYAPPATADCRPPSAHHHHHQQQQQQPRRHDVFVREVKAANLAGELSTIRALLPRYPYVTVHAEYPGCDDDPNLLPPSVRWEDLSPAARYGLAKIDVDALRVRQLGITLCDAGGRLPVLPVPGPCGGGGAASVWQIGFRDSDARHSVTTSAFAAAMFASGVVSGETWGRVAWVAFGGLYHFGFLLKILTGGAPLPDTKDEFAAVLRAYLGGGVLDGRYVAARLPTGVSVEGSLACVASLLRAPAAAAAKKPWQAGVKSLAACQVLMRMKGLFFAWYSIDSHAGRIHGLH